MKRSELFIYNIIVSAPSPSPLRNVLFILLKQQDITEPGILEFLSNLTQKNEQVLKKVDFSFNKAKPETREIVAAKLFELGLSQLNVIV